MGDVGIPRGLDHGVWSGMGWPPPRFSARGCQNQLRSCKSHSLRGRDSGMNAHTSLLATSATPSENESSNRLKRPLHWENEQGRRPPD